MFFGDLGSLAPSDVPKCAKTVVLPADYMTTTDANYLSGYGPSSSSAKKKTNWVPIVVGGVVITVVAYTLLS